MSQLTAPVDLVDAPVPIVPWPDHDDTRRVLCTLGVPRLLLLPAGMNPPPPLDQLEDWLREPPDPVELQLRAEALAARAVPHDLVPTMDEDGILRVGAAWVAITPQQVPVMHLLLRHLDRVVRHQAIIDAYASAGGSDHPPSVRTLLSRLSARIKPLGLELVAVRRRGVLLTVTAPA